MKNKKNKYTTVILVLVALLVIVGWGLWLMNSRGTEKTDITQEQVKAGEAIKENSISDKESNSGSEQPPSPTPSESGKSVANVTVTSVNQTDNSLQIRVLIGDIEANGSCTLTITREGYSALIKTAEVQALANSTTCKGFDVPLAELSPGEWKFSLVYESDKAYGSADREVTIR